MTIFVRSYWELLLLRLLTGISLGGIFPLVGGAILEGCARRQPAGCLSSAAGRHRTHVLMMLTWFRTCGG